MRQAEIYNIITDEEELKRFISWLPDLNENEKFYMCLFGRKKYAKDAGFEIPWIKSDKGQLKRLLTDKDRMVSKIKQLECPVGSYTFEDNSFPQECLALYITPNPRDLFRVLTKSITKFVQMLECKATNANPHQEVLSEIQRTPVQSKPFSIFDFDWKDRDKLKKMVDIVDQHCDVIETRGGYHMLVDNTLKDKIRQRLWYPMLKEHSDVQGDSMIPVPGTYQGGWTPRFIFNRKLNINDL